MLKSFKSFKSFKGDSNVSFQILCKSTAILLYRCEENIKNLLNVIMGSSATPTPTSPNPADSPLSKCCGW